MIAEVRVMWPAIFESQSPSSHVCLIWLCKRCSSLIKHCARAVQAMLHASCKHCANTNQACYLWCACSVQTMLKQCSSKLTPLLDFAWTLFAHCLYTLLEHFFRCLISAWFCLNMLDCASMSPPPPVQAMIKQAWFCLISAWFWYKQWSSSVQAVIKQWKNCKKIKQVCLILLDHAWFCLIIAWSLLDFAWLLDFL